VVEEPNHTAKNTAVGHAVSFVIHSFPTHIPLLKTVSALDIKRVYIMYFFD
jgi:hypothetical protein